METIVTAEKPHLSTGKVRKELLSERDGNNFYEKGGGAQWKFRQEGTSL